KPLGGAVSGGLPKRRPLGLPGPADRRLGVQQLHRPRFTFFHLRGPRLRRSGAGAVASNKARRTTTGRGVRLMATAFAGGALVPVTACDRPIRVFVHLAHGFGASQWEAKWKRSEIIGINDRLPYGYFWAREDRCLVEYSEDKEEWLVGKLVRLGIRALLGFDFVHAWRNRRSIGRAEVVWTHTESQYLAVLLLFQARRRTRRPKLIAQSVWLFDRWDRLSRPRRWFYAWLMRQADVLTVHSPENLQRARELFPMCRSEIVPFGIRTEPIRSREPRKPHCPIRV